MAERRCISSKIANSDAFLDMPASSQALYFHLVLAADDDGFIDNPRSIIRFVGASNDDLKLLVTKRFVLMLDNLVVIKHWGTMNSYKADRLCTPKYPEAAERLRVKPDGSYTDRDDDSLPTLLCSKNDMVEKRKAGSRRRSDSERNPDGIQSEDKRNPNGIQMDENGILKEKKIKEKKGKENKRKEYVVDDVIGVPPDDCDGESFPSENVGDDVLKPIGGIYGKNVVYLTDRQNDDLLRRLSTDEYDRYISALADWLIHNPDARIHSHYETILHWADEDRKVRAN